MRKKLIYLTLVLVLFITTNLSAVTGSSAGTKFSDVTQNYNWAYDAINELTSRGIISGMDNTHFAPGAPVTKEQFAKMLLPALEIAVPSGAYSTYQDVPGGRWSKDYIMAAKNYMYDSNSSYFHPEEKYSRENCAYAIASALGIAADKNLLDKNVISSYFRDGSQINSAIITPVSIIVERAIVRGDSGMLRPKGEVTRAEAAVMLYRAIQYKARNSHDMFITKTPLIGPSKISVDQAKRWAANCGAHQRFIDIADIYWKYGELTGIRPEILYAQAAKETGYGKYTGQVKPEQNNWAGIKIKNPVADRPEDHETFATPDDGVRAHFNHVSAYVGIAPIGTPHDRYYVLNTMSWKGTVVYTEELGGKWAPDITYGYNIAVKLLRAMANTK